MSRNSWSLKVWTAVATLAMFTGVSGQLLAQTIAAPKYANENAGRGVVTDWSTRHLIFSTVGTEPPTSNAPAHARWLKASADPRYAMQAQQRSASAPATSKAVSDFVASQASTKNNKKVTLQRDWALSLGSGHVAAGMSPAKYSFDTTGSLTSANCTSDFVVYGLDVVGVTNGQANLVGVDNLYAGSGGLCGSNPSVTWAYNVTTTSYFGTANGVIATSPVLSPDGTMVAFVESGRTGTTTYVSILHVLKWKASNGTVTAAVAPSTATNNISTCTAPCMTSVTFSTGSSSVWESTLSAPYYDYEPDDTLYVGNNNGHLYAITGVFTGTPTVLTSNGWSSSGITLASGSQLGPPVLDLGSGNIFVGAANGDLYAVSSGNAYAGTTGTAGTIYSQPVGSGNANGGGIVDGPIVDESAGTVLAYAASNAANVGATLANTTAVVVQADTTTPLGNVQIGTIGSGAQGAAGNANVDIEAGALDNGYFTWSGTGPNAGHFYEIGTNVATTVAPVLFQIPYSGISAVAIQTPGSHYTSPAASITDSTGSGASLTPTGGVDSITLTAGGGGFTALPSQTFSPAPLTGGNVATASVSVGLTAINVTSGGSGFSSVPAVGLSGTGSAGTASASMGVNSVTITNAGGSYASLPSVGFSGTATGTPLVGLSSLSGSGGSFSSVPTITIGGTVSGAAGTATPNLGVSTIAVNAAGSGYTSVPAINFPAGGSPVATATALMGVNSVTVGAGGGYTGTSVPTVTFTGGATNATGSALVGVSSISGTGGSFSTLPSITVSGSGTGGGTATPNLGVSTITGAGGSGYTAPATISFAGTANTAASATAVMGVNTVTVNGGGSYTSFPSVTFTGGTTNATGSVLVGLSSIGGTGGSFSSVPTITISGSGGGTATPNLGVSSIGVSSGGSGYTSAPTISFAGTANTAASATAVMGVSAVSVSSRGCYNSSDSAPTVNFSGGGGGSGASATATLSATRSTCNFGYVELSMTVTVNSAGTGYTSAPTVTFTCGTGCSEESNASGSSTLLIVSVTVNSAGSYNNSFPTASVTGNATLTTTATLVSTNVTAAGSYTAIPTASITGGTPTLSVTAKVVSVSVATAGTGYTAAPTITFSPTGATATGDLKVLSVTVNTAGSYNNSFPTASASGGITNPTLTTTASLVNVNVTVAGSYTAIPTASITGGTPTLSVTAKVVSVSVSAAGSGYTAAPTITFSPTGATASADLKVVNVNVGTAGSYNNTFPTATAGSGNATFTTTAMIVSANVTAAGSYSTFPTASATGVTFTVTAKVVGVTVTAAGSGYTSTPTITFTPTGATASADLKVVSIAVGTPGSYTTFPTASITGGTTNPVLATVCDVVALAVVGSSSGSGYSEAPSLTLTGGTSDSTGSTTINVNAVSVTYGGGDYTAPSVSITDTGSGSGTVVGAITVNDGSVMTPGTPPGPVNVSTTTNLGVTSITEIFNPNLGSGGADLLFFGYGKTGTGATGAVVSEDVTDPTSISAGATPYTVPSAIYGTSAIVVDNISPAGQASSIYFSTLATSTGTCGTTVYCAVKLTQSGLN